MADYAAARALLPDTICACHSLTAIDQYPVTFHTHSQRQKQDPQPHTHTPIHLNTAMGPTCEAHDVSKQLLHVLPLTGSQCLAAIAGLRTQQA